MVIEMNSILSRKLILIEGLPDTDKTSLSNRIFQHFNNHNKPAALLQATDKTSGNLSGIAGVPHNAFFGLLNNIQCIAKTKNYIFADLVSDNHNEEIKALLQQYHLGDASNTSISARGYAKTTLEWWQHWASQNADKPAIIMERAFLQNPINQMLCRKASDADIESYIRAIVDILKHFDPLCIYLRRPNGEVPTSFARQHELEQSLLPLIDHIVCDVDGHDWSDVDAKLQLNP